MEIAICGASLPPFDKSVLKRAYEIGKEIAVNSHTLRFGGCWGYPHEAAKGAFESKGEVIAISPAKNRQEHAKKYRFPLSNISEIKYTDLGIPGRNIPLVVESDAVVFISGQIGTLNEFTIAYYHKKPIGILAASGGISSLIKRIAKICMRVGEKDRIVYSRNPKLLVHRLIKLNQ